MWKWIIGSVAILAVVAGCGNGTPPPIAFPADGQLIDLNQRNFFDVTLADNDYQDVSIEIRGAEVFEGKLVCTNGVNSPARCYYQQNQAFGGFNQACIESRPCTLVIIARRGNAVDVRTAKVYLGTNTSFQQTPQQQ